jgi:hypothetical protein
VDEEQHTLAVSLDDTAAKPTAVIGLHTDTAAASWTATVKCEDAVVNEQLLEMMQRLQKADAPAQ